MLLPFLLLGGKMKNCQLFTFQVKKLQPAANAPKTDAPATKIAA